MKRRQSGRTSPYTAEQLEHIRDVHTRWHKVRRERIRLCKELGVRSDVFSRIGLGHYGKKPREA